MLLTAALLLTACLPATVAADQQPAGDGGALPYTQIDQEQARRMMAQNDGHVVVDVRRQDEYETGHIPGAICIPNESIGAEPPEALPDLDQIILVYCRSGNRSKQAAQKLGGMGYRHVYEFGGIVDWTGEIVTGPTPDGLVDLEDFVGCYETDGYDTVTIQRGEDGYTMSVGLYRLTTLDEGTVSASSEGVVFHALDPAGDPMTLSFYQEAGGWYTLRIDESTWLYLEPGTVFSRWRKVAAADDAPKGHYTFRPKVCSVYMEEVFGKDMCDAWSSLVDAVMAGKNTFACKDQHTYDWVMGQFRERCFPVLTELIDYAWDREHSVRDGVASFVYTVPVDEAAQRIREFGAQIEGILNRVLGDDYTDLEKALALYEYFSQTYEYDYETYYKMYEAYVDYTSGYRFFQTGIGICHEISTAYSYLLMQAGVEATVMMGSDHQWSYVRINGHDYHIDPTFVLSDKGSLAYFMMTDEQRKATGYGREEYTITSNYAQDHPHPDYAANDDTFAPLWDKTFEAFFPETHTIRCWIESGDFGEWTYFDFDYTGF